MLYLCPVWIVVRDLRHLPGLNQAGSGLPFLVRRIEDGRTIPFTFRTMADTHPAFENARQKVSSIRIRSAGGTPGGPALLPAGAGPTPAYPARGK